MKINKSSAESLTKPEINTPAIRPSKKIQKKVERPLVRLSQGGIPPTRRMAELNSTINKANVRNFIS